MIPKVPITQCVRIKLDFIHAIALHFRDVMMRSEIGVHPFESILAVDGRALDSDEVCLIVPDIPVILKFGILRVC